MKKETRMLNCDAIDCTPITIDWREAAGENCDGWTAHEAIACSECGRVVAVSSLGEQRHSDVEAEIESTEEGAEDGDMEPCTCRGYLSAEGPMMNYWYPVKIGDCTAAAVAIQHLPLCVVEFPDGQTGIALTGGGMDLSWEICEAFIALGYWPPLHFCDLPRMGNRGTSDADRSTIAACVESCKIAAGWARRKGERLRENFPEQKPAKPAKRGPKARKRVAA